MTTIEKKKEHLKVFQDHIKTSKAKFDTTEKFEFQRRETAYYAARYSKKILYGSRAEAEKNLIKLTNSQNILSVVILIGFGIAASFLSLPILLFLVVGSIVSFIYQTDQLNQARIMHMDTLHQILFYEGETKKALRKSHLRYEQEAYDIETDEDFRKLLDAEEIILIQDLYKAEVQVAIINEMAE
jgi:hypothetical protein